MKYEDIKDFLQRCEEHPDHQSGMITNAMIQQRLHEEIDELRDYIEQAEKQEPVAWMYVNVDGECEQIEYGACDYDDPSITFLYTAPPRKKWVGLDDEDWMNVPDFQKEGCELDAAIYDWIEARLKEKNT